MSNVYINVENQKLCCVAVIQNKISEGNKYINKTQINI